MTELHVSISDGVALLTIDRPEANNSMGGALLKELLLTAQQLEANDDVRVIVTTANVKSGATAWSPGADFAHLDGKLGPGADADSMYFDGTMQGEHALLRVSRQGRRFDPLGPGRWMLDMTDAFQKPTIAAINGAVAGGGIGLAALHIYRIAGESVRFKAAFSGLGVGTDMGASWYLPRIVGPTAATEILLRNKPFDAARALEIGLIHQVVPDDQVIDASLEVARELAAMPPLGMRATVRALREAQENSLKDQLALEWDNQRITFATEDAKAAFYAFRDRTEGTYVGR